MNFSKINQPVFVSSYYGNALIVLEFNKDKSFENYNWSAINRFTVSFVCIFLSRVSWISPVFQRGSRHKKVITLTSK